MKNKLIHPWWTHIPALGALLVLLVFIAVKGPFSGVVPIHFNYAGVADSYGSAWQVFGMVIGLSVFFILLSGLLDELWARQEKKKTFNWLSLLDDIVVGSLVGISLGVGYAAFPWMYLWLIGGSALILAIILEIVRPYRYYAIKIIEKNTETLKTEILHRIKDNVPLVYWDSQNPVYVTLLTTILPLILLGAAVSAWFSEQWVSLLLAVVALLLILPYGGLRVIVTRENITVRFGMFGLRVLRLAIEEVAAAETHRFSPLKDFGGYGIRFNREMTAYYLSGTLGVKITSVKGKKYLIGSDNAERLATVISTIAVGK